MKKFLSEKLNKVVKELYGVDFKSEVGYPRDKSYGDYATNIAMQLANAQKKNLKDVAREIIDRMKSDKKISDIFSDIKEANGFINFKFSENFLKAELGKILSEKSNYGNSNISKNKKVQIEFVSANPTGPVTMANGRGGFLGDALANILKKVGYKTQKEYYVNDVGNQIDILAESVARKILEIKGQEIDHPDYCYKGDYIKDIAKSFIGEVKTEYNSIGEITEAVKKYSLTKLMMSIEKDLENAGIIYDRWFFESELYNKSWYQKRSEVDKILHYLDKENLLEEKDGATWFQTSNFGDDKDRVIIKETGEKTYFASDIAYFNNKVERGFDKIIEIWGADHHGYVPRIKAISKALKFEDKIEFILVQMVRLIEGGEIKKISKRAGDIVTLNEILEKVGKDAARFFFLMYDSNTHMDFDLDLAQQKSQKNPVYYIQYAYARICSIIKKAEEGGINIKNISKFDKHLFSEISEINLIKEMMKLPDVLEEVTQDYEVCKLAHYCLELARSFHDFYENCKVISEDKELTLSRLKTIMGTKIILKEVLQLMGISAPEKM